MKIHLVMGAVVIIWFTVFWFVTRGPSYYVNRAVVFDRKCQAVGFNQRQCEFFRFGADDANPREGEGDIVQ